MKAIVVGATGAVGRDLVEVLCHDQRYTEVRTSISVKVFQLLNAVGLFRSMAPISTEIVAHCMAEAGAEPFCGVRRISKQAIRHFGK